jgi:hypothetical protein
VASQSRYQIGGENGGNKMEAWLPEAGMIETKNEASF